MRVCGCVSVCICSFLSGSDVVVVGVATSALCKITCSCVLREMGTCFFNREPFGGGSLVAASTWNGMEWDGMR